MRNLFKFGFAAILTVAVWTAAPGSNPPKGEKLSPQELIAKHLAALGTAKSPEAVKSRVAEGVARIRNLTGNDPRTLEGPATLVSDGTKLAFRASFNVSDHPLERFGFDGDSVRVAFIRPGVRSGFGNFLWTYGQDIVREGLIGGVLTTAWPLADVETRKAKLRVEGPKKVDDEQVYELKYEMKKGGSGLSISVLFDPFTFRHVRTLYRFLILQSSSRDFGAQSPDFPTAGNETRVTLDERFEDFRTCDGLDLPTRWTLRLGSEQAGTGANVLWEIRFEKITTDRKIEIKDFLRN